MRTLVLRVNPLVQLSVGLFSLLGSFWIRSLPVALVALAAYVLAAAIAVNPRHASSTSRPPRRHVE
jgi:energy-coupling factor transport system permease protein